MTTAVVCIICIAMVVVGCMTLSQGILTSADTAALSAQQLSVREGEIMRTRLTGLSATLPAAGTLQALIENSGQTRLASFDKWDCIVCYYDASDDYYVNWLPYDADAPGDNEWQQTGIYFDSEPETFEPGILNPQESLAIQANLAPEAGYRAIKFILATPNGVAPTLVCGPPTLTAHTETVSLGDTDYYMLKGWAPADGTAVTETTFGISRHETGRWLLHDSSDSSRYATHLYPLSNVNEISASTWTVHYRGRADDWGRYAYDNASLTIDIIIRQADGTIREILDTNVAQAVFTDGREWIDISASYSFPGYAVVDETDYLEIDYYGNSEGDGPEGTAYIRLRVDDDMLPEESQTRIQGMEWP